MTSNSLQTLLTFRIAQRIPHRMRRNTNFITMLLLEPREIDSSPYFPRQGLSMMSFYTGSDHRPHFKWQCFMTNKYQCIALTNEEQNITNICCFFLWLIIRIIQFQLHIKSFCFIMILKIMVIYELFFNVNF